MAAEPVEGWNGEEGLDAPEGPPPGGEEADRFAEEILREAAVESCEHVPAPTVYQKYDLRKVPFWEHGKVPTHSVVVYPEIQPGTLEVVKVALLVLGAAMHLDGVWLNVRYLGCSKPTEHRRLQAIFKGGNTSVHLCYLMGGECPRKEEDAVHTVDLEWYPAGEADMEWLTAHAKRTPKMSVEERLRSLKEAHSPGDALRGAGGEPPRRGVLRGGRQVTFGDGTVLPDQATSSALVPVQQVPADGEPLREEVQEKQKKKTISDTLASAAVARLEKTQKEKEKGRSRSRSKAKSKKDKKSKKRKSSSDGGSGGSEESESSSASLMPPLKKKSTKDPGSVFRMLENQAREHLSQLEEDEENPSKTGTKGRLFAYFQIVLRPQLDPKSRDCKEIAMLAKALDLLKGGKLSELADVLAARLIAVDTSTKQGWGTARHLEVHQAEDEGVAPPHVLLAAQKHARAVDKAGGKGSWPKQSGWGWDSWQSDNRPKGKGKDQKGKGKKGKGKPRQQKGGWENWQSDPKEKGDPKKPDA